jgi:hypothetical protein
MAWLGNLTHGTRQQPQPYKVEDFFKEDTEPQPKEVDWGKIEAVLRAMYPQTKTENGKA